MQEPDRSLPDPQGAQFARGFPSHVRHRLEDKLIQRRFTGQGRDTTRWPAELVSKMTYLAGDIDSSDDVPTTQAKDIQSDYEKQIGALQQELDGGLEKDLTNFNRMLRDRGIQNVVK